MQEGEEVEKSFFVNIQDSMHQVENSTLQEAEILIRGTSH